MKEEMIAMLLAGGKGTRLNELTRKVAKPVVNFGGKYRIIDFTLSNCANSSINVVGVLTQYESSFLNEYVGSGQKWGLDANGCSCVLLSPRQGDEGILWYEGTASAIEKNIDFMDKYNPKYVLVLSADHIYKMDYNKMLETHKKNKADCTISVVRVPIEDASRFGILNINPDSSILEFDEKPAKPKSNLASMGIYIFSYDVLKKYLTEAEEHETDFGKHIIPKMLNNKLRMFTYVFDGYWKDVGTVTSLWEANMDLLNENNELNKLRNWKIFSQDTFSHSQLIGANSRVNNSIVSNGCIVEGEVSSSILFNDVMIAKNAVVKDSILLPGVIVEDGARVYKAIVNENYVIEKSEVINEEQQEIILISE